jgi:mycothiol synthase
MIHQRKFTGASDQNKIIDLCRRASAETLHVIDLPYRLSSWALDDPGNVGLWEDEYGQLVAWAIMQSPFWTIDYAFQTGLESELHAQVLEWADQRARHLLSTPYGHPSWFVNVFPHQAERIQLLEHDGFTCQSTNSEDAWTQVWMEREGNSLPPVASLPPGFTARPLAGEAELEAYVELHQAVFETKNMTVEWRQRTINHPDYQPGADMVVVAPDGELAAFCIGWLGKNATGERIGQIEPLGRHAAYQGFGLGRSILCETIHRLIELGAQNIYVETDGFRTAAFQLYESVGFKVLADVLVYGKDYNDSAV